MRCLKAWQCLKNLHHRNDQMDVERDTLNYADVNYCYAIMSTLFHKLFPKHTLSGVPALAYITHGCNSSGVSLPRHVSPTGHCPSGVSLPWRGSPMPVVSEGCPCSSLEPLLPIAHLQLYPQQCPHPYVSSSSSSLVTSCVSYPGSYHSAEAPHAPLFGLSFGGCWVVFIRFRALWN